MADVYLIWYSLTHGEIPASREQLRQWLVELALPSGPLARTSRAHRFASACRGTRTSYEDAEGRRWTLSGHLKNRTSHLVTFEVQRDDGQKMAQLKYFPPRRTCAGVVTDSDTFARFVRPDLDLDERVGVGEWLSAAQAGAEQKGLEVSPRNVRDLARMCFDAVATPVLGRNSMFFAYGDERGTIERITTLLLRCHPEGDVTVLGIEAGSDLTRLMDSADALLAHQMGGLIASVNAYMVSPRRKMGLTLMMERWGEQIAEFERQMTRHERFLGATLEGCRVALTDIKELIELGHPKSDLL